MDDPRPPVYRIFNEIGIINQLATALLARRLPDGVHPSQFLLLGNLVRLGDGKTPAMLAQAFQVPKASMTNTLMQLEKQGLIAVAAHPGDLRKKVVTVTEAGRDLYLRTVGEVARPLAALVSEIDGLEDILPVLERLRRTMDENREP